MNERASQEPQAQQPGEASKGAAPAIAGQEEEQAIMEASQVNGHSLADQLERAFDADRWDRAEKLCRRALAAEPDDHWWWTRLGTALYEQHRYSEALKATERALSFQPECPLVLWDYACDLDMLGREREAIAVWQGLLSRGVRGVACGECGEGRRWAESLLNDCRYRIARSFFDLGERTSARRHLAAHVRHRRRGLPSLYDRRKVTDFARQLSSEYREKTATA